MGNRDCSKGKSTEGAEALIRRIRRAKDSTYREPSRSTTDETCIKPTRLEMDGLEVSEDYAFGIIHGLITARELLDSSGQTLASNLMSSQIQLMEVLIARFKLGDKIRIPSMSDDD